MVNRMEMRIGRSASREWMRWALLLAGAVLLAFALVSSGKAGAATYKWVDEKGVVHYTDKMPPEEMNKGTTEFNKQGVPIKKTDPAPTPEQRRAMALEEQRQRELAKQQDDQSRRDRALLSSYTSESEIDLSRNRSLRTIESVVESSKAYAEQLAKRKAGIEAKKKTDYASKPLPAPLERELESINAELVRQDELITQKQKEVVAVNARFDADKKRWRELIAAKGGEAALLSDVNVLPVAAPTSAKK